MTSLTSHLSVDIIPLTPFWRRSGEIMKGWGYYFPKGRKYGRIFGRWNKRSVKINKRWDGKPLYSRQDCEDTLDIIAHQIKDGTFDPAMWGKDRTIQIERAWAIYQEQSPCGKDRMEARERIFQDFILPYFKGKILTEIEEHHIKDWWSGIGSRQIAARRQGPQVNSPVTERGITNAPSASCRESEGCPYAPSYLKVIRATLRAFLSFHRVTRVKMLAFPMIRVPKKTIEWLKRDEQNRIISFMPEHHQPIFKFLRSYGCRVTEACTLRKSDVEWEKNCVVFRQRKNLVDNVLPIFDEVRSTLKPGKVTNLEYVFCTINGEKYNRQILYRIWTDACKKAGAKIIPLKNATRHSLACQLLNNGEELSMVARILGISQSVVYRFYGTISIERIKEVHDRVSQMCSSTKDQ
jgi:integrase/recombinase XerD